MLAASACLTGEGAGSGRAVLAPGGRRLHATLAERACRVLCRRAAGLGNRRAVCPAMPTVNAAGAQGAVPPWPHERRGLPTRRHGGPCAAAFVRDRLFASLLSHESFPRDLMKALADAYADTDEQYCELDGEQQRDDGCTAVTGVLVGSRLAVAHVGDSRFGRLDGWAAARQPCGPQYMQAAGCTAGTARRRW